MIRAALLIALLAVAPSYAAVNVDFTPAAGAQLNLTLPFTDETGAAAPLASYVAGRPTLLIFGYHRCPNLCGVADLELAQALRTSRLPPQRYSVIFASIDPSETAIEAQAARQKLADADPAADLTPWHFVTGSAPAIAALKNSVGLTVERREGTDLYVHPVAVSVLTPEGKVSRVFPGIDYAPRDIRLALIEASEGKLGTLSEHLILLCSAFDPTSGRYTSAIMLALRATSGAALLLIGGALLRLERSRRA